MMNDSEFKQRAYADPQDNSPEFLAALAEQPEREAFLASLQAFNMRLCEGLTSIPVPEGLRERLLDPESLASRSASRTGGAGGQAGGVLVSRPWLWQKALPIAASLLIAVGLVFFSLPQQQQQQVEPGNLSASEQTLAREVFGHIYAEIDFLDMNDHLSIAALNQKMSLYEVGGHLGENPVSHNLDVKVAEDCWVAQQYSMHMVIAGEKGPVTIFMIPSAIARSTMSISDSRFDGIVSPTPKGNLVVVGEKQESIGRYVNLIASNMEWEY
ncbi:MAG: DUF3379 family protein [Pseudomonadales bacterium]|nr:DUF3379 family protein [Pseudomonadales bacterium]